MINLKNTTFIIPLYIESVDRSINARIILSYIAKHLDTNVIIYEYDVQPKADVIVKYLPNIKYVFSKNTDSNPIFHRTRFINEMLNMVQTPVVVNHDVDVLLKPEAYRQCANLIINGQDLVFPYFFGESQYEVYYGGREKLSGTLSLDVLSDRDYKTQWSEYGHCQFFKTSSYRAGGMENEGFISYAPEDKERLYRFKTLGYNVMWARNFIYHLWHTRGINSSNSNPLMSQNNALFEHIKSLDKDRLRKYYNEIGYIKKYV